MRMSKNVNAITIYNNGEIKTYRFKELRGYIAIKIAKKTKGDSWLILLSFSLFTAFASALLDNVTTVLLIAPITILIAEILDISPLPFLIAEILASNIGGTATLIGDPPNIIIGINGNIIKIPHMNGIT